ncbi:cytochrome c peroxidase [Hasllibacter halocynthiae]|uniref:Cytochrome c peroxidase n=1 Tax=Hasllibacter halocynthiae TaxID=595589 RepID=A0A2T0X950_9RHOB|nr:cytochrome c peroxidase [Hasllibacter halocynthiae]
MDPADFPDHPAPLVELGRLLFHDPILSGNRNIACATCHAADHGGGDGLSLGIGEGGAGTGPDRTAEGIEKRIPRNAPGLWNLGHRDVSVLFHDGRLEASDIFGNGFSSPAEEWLPGGLDSILAAQALFPMTARFEMAGSPTSGEVGGAVNDRIDAAWPILAARVSAVPDYFAMIRDAFPEVRGEAEVTAVHLANALAAFMTVQFESHDSPFDRHLRGEPGVLAPEAAEGMALFYGRAGCAACHSGTLLSDQGFHALGLPAFGPGRTRTFDPIPRDVGRMAESDRAEDAYRFRTPMLRNVALTAPYGHNGAFPTLEGIVRHHLDPAASLARWQPEDAALPPAPRIAAVDFAIRQDAREMARQAAALDIAPAPMTDAEVDALVAFLHALTGETARALPLAAPETVPSGLPPG